MIKKWHTRQQQQKSKKDRMSDQNIQISTVVGVGGWFLPASWSTLSVSQLHIFFTLQALGLFKCLPRTLSIIYFLPTLTCSAALITKLKNDYTLLEQLLNLRDVKKGIFRAKSEHFRHSCNWFHCFAHFDRRISHVFITFENSSKAWH